MGTCLEPQESIEGLGFGLWGYNPTHLYRQLGTEHKPCNYCTSFSPVWIRISNMSMPGGLGITSSSQGTLNLYTWAVNSVDDDCEWCLDNLDKSKKSKGWWNHPSLMDIWQLFLWKNNVFIFFHFLEQNKVSVFSESWLICLRFPKHWPIIDKDFIAKHQVSFTTVSSATFCHLVTSSL